MKREAAVPYAHMAGVLADMEKPPSPRCYSTPGLAARHATRTESCVTVTTRVLLLLLLCLLQACLRPC